MRALFLTLPLLVACGGPAAAPHVLPHPSASTSTGAPVSTTTPLPSSLPPFAEMPAPGVRGSTKAKVKQDPSFEACYRTIKGKGTDLAADATRLGQACAGATKSKQVGAPFRGKLEDSAGHQEFKFRAEANHCYRIYSASSADIVDLAIAMRDSKGDMVVDASTDVVPRDGAVCFTEADEVTLLVSVGRGKGNMVLQVWAD